MTNGLVASGEFMSSSATQRFSHQKSGFPVDIVPFGKIAASKDAILWPPENAVEMNILGFAEAYGHAWTVRLSNDLEIPFASPAGWALLKIISWNDRDLLRIPGTPYLIIVKKGKTGTGCQVTPSPGEFSGHGKSLLFGISVNSAALE